MTRQGRPPRPLDAARLEELALAYVARFGAESYGGVRNYLKDMQNYLDKKLMKHIGTGGDFSKLTAMATSSTLLTMWGGNLFAPALKYLENNKEKIVTRYNEKHGTPEEVAANAQSVTIGNDGTVSVVLPGQSLPQTVGQLQLANFVNPGGLLSLGENLYGETTASGTASVNQPGTNGVGLLNQGYVETSNVNVVEELVTMIQTQRAYEMNSKAVQTSDQMLQKLAQL